MRSLPFIILGTIVLLGCARVNVVAPKEAIKLDVSMRLDVYQHVAKDIDNIEDMVSGTEKKTAAREHQSFLGAFETVAYADEGGLGEDVLAAVNSRKGRRSSLLALEAKGAVGENASGLVEIRSGSGGQDLVQAENNDRMLIYKAVAQKNGTSLDEVQQLYAKRLQGDAPSGTPVEGASGWAVKS